MFGYFVTSSAVSGAGVCVCFYTRKSKRALACANNIQGTHTRTHIKTHIHTLIIGARSLGFPTSRFVLRISINDKRALQREHSLGSCGREAHTGKSCSPVCVWCMCVDVCWLWVCECVCNWPTERTNAIIESKCLCECVCFTCFFFVGKGLI